MLETRDAGGQSGVFDDSILRLTRSSSAEQFEASTITALRDRFAGYRTAEARAILRVCVAAAYASALRVPRWMAHSQRDYASALLGVKHSTFCRWVKAGRLLCARAELREQLIAGRMTISQLERIWANSDAPTTASATAAEVSSADSDSTFVSLSITGPAPAILYMEDSLDLARAMVGSSHGDEDALSALLSEAATESTYHMDATLARRRFRVREGADRAGEVRVDEGCAGQGDQQQGCGQRHRELSSAARDDRGQAANHPDLHTRLEVELTCPLLRQMGETAQRDAAFRVHAILMRLIARRHRLRVRQEDQLFEWMLDQVHERAGFRNFTRFAFEILDLPPTSCNDRLHHARQRRREHPLAVARAEGAITAVQAQLLDRLHRRSHVPMSDSARWIRYAGRHTVRRLRTAIEWAHRQFLLDYRSWSLVGCRPPHEDEVRTTDHSLESLVRHSGGDELADALVSWDLAPRATARFLISIETRDELLIQMASMQDELRGTGESVAPHRIPGWLAACRVFHRAREAWRVHHQTQAAAQRRILDRDGWQCAAPECTQRKNLQVHHVKYRSRGGGDADENRVTLCAFHHQLGEHGGLMRVRGRIGEDGRGLTWEMGMDGFGRAQRVYRDERILASA